MLIHCRKSNNPTKCSFGFDSKLDWTRKMICCLCMVLKLDFILFDTAVCCCYTFIFLQKKAVGGEFGKNIQSTTMLVEDKDPRLKVFFPPKITSFCDNHL